MGSIAVAGSVAQRPGRGGHAWVFLNYLLGLRNLGHEVVFIGRLTSEMVQSESADIGRSREARWLGSVMAASGFGDRYFLLEEGSGNGQAGSRSPLLERLRRTD